MTYEKLKPGDTRRKGDEVRRFVDGNNGSSEAYLDTDWHPVRLLDSPILPSDLVACEFRRPLPLALS